MIINQTVSGGGSSPVATESIALDNINGTLVKAAVQPVLNTNAIDIISAYVLAYAYKDNTFLTQSPLNGSDNMLTLDTGCLMSAFEGCTSLTNTGLSTTSGVSMDCEVGQFALKNTYKGCTSLVLPELPMIASINGDEGMYGIFEGCTNLYANFEFAFLRDVTGERCLSRAFAYTDVTNLLFPALQYVSNPENAFENMCAGLTNCTVHFPSDTYNNFIAGYESTFGGTNTQVLGDLDPIEPEPEPEPEEPEE